MDLSPVGCVSLTCVSLVAVLLVYFNSISITSAVFVDTSMLCLWLTSGVWVGLPSILAVSTSSAPSAYIIISLYSTFSLATIRLSPAVPSTTPPLVTFVTSFRLLPGGSMDVSGDINLGFSDISCATLWFFAIFVDIVFSILISMTNIYQSGVPGASAVATARGATTVTTPGHTLGHVSNIFSLHSGLFLVLCLAWLSNLVLSVSFL